MRRTFVVWPMIIVAALMCAPILVRAQEDPAAREAALPAAEPLQVNLDQGWSAEDRRRWYGATQGSRLVPLAWLRALEQPDGAGLFLDDAYIAHFGYLPRAAALPVGFAIDDQDDDDLGATKLRWRSGQGANEPWVGFTCSACHTAELTYKGTRLRIDGGPTVADFQTFINTFNDALARTSTDAARFDRFAARVLGARDTRANRNRLKKAVERLVAYQQGIAAMNETNLSYGHARLDAVGYILNKVSFVSTQNQPTANEPDAPVSYPFLWAIPQHRFVQWNGIGENKPEKTGEQTFDYGALGRNVGEVIGVFGDVRPRGFMQLGARSSIDTVNLVALEQQLERLKAPRWPSEVFGAPDPQLVSEGRALFGERCASCHMPLARGDNTTRPVEQIHDLASAATDPWMACNTMTNEARAGALAGQRRNLDGGGRLGEIEPASEMLRLLVTQAVMNKLSSVSESAIASHLGAHPRPRVVDEVEGSGAVIAAASSGPGAYTREERRQRCATAQRHPVLSRGLAYKARPLNGVWATAPYLHNGSVANLYELLLPPAERGVSFNVGTREYDPVNVGYLTEARPDNPFVFNVRDAQGVLIEGNSNAGHDYGNAQFTPRQRQALVEYLKVIGE